MRVALVLTTAAALVLTACGTSDESTGPESGNGAEGAFPVEVTDKYGTVTIEEQPERIVTVGFNDQDFVLALGQVPVGTREYMGFDYQNRPWAQEQLDGQEIPEVGGLEVNAEQVAALDPDLILGTYSVLEPDQYDTLSQIAPMVGDLEASDGTSTPSWQEQLAAIGDAMGARGEAEQLRADVEQDFRDAVEANPRFEGRTAAVALHMDDGSFYILEAGDPRNRFFSDLGFATPAVTGEVGPERYDLLDQENLIVVGATAETLADDELFQSLDVVSSDRTVYLGEFGTTAPAALGFASPLSLPYLIDAVLPSLVAATDDDPATVVPAVEE
ncbi:ABC transporter substrate-binding protein [Rhodococcus sp. SJ-2]